MASYRHSFALCAYKESEFLEQCLLSLLGQTVASRIYISTSTPNEHIRRIADKYGIEVFVNTGIKGITGDWNFAVSKADTEYVTIAHQDDCYEAEYAEKVIAAMDRHKKPIIAFSEYYEIRNGKKELSNSLLKIKRIMNSPFKLFPGSRFVRNRILSVGNPICCPAVTFCRKGCKDFAFDPDMKVACDWEAWVRLAQNNGDFVYISDPLMGHRIYEGSTTTEMITNGIRYEEELMIYKKYWPEAVARFLVKKYSAAYSSNDVSK
ncbi:MAG: glycosyltransferase [Oscillospiraceae bacterium]|nr:glycosyltransferase [Oscillospiraceae bacterium]